MPDAAEQLIRLSEVQRRTGIRRTQIYALAAAGKFPKPIKLSERITVWPLSEISEWVAERIAASRNAGGEVNAPRPARNAGGQWVTADRTAASPRVCPARKGA